MAGEKKYEAEIGKLSVDLELGQEAQLYNQITVPSYKVKEMRPLIAIGQNGSGKTSFRNFVKSMIENRHERSSYSSFSISQSEPSVSADVGRRDNEKIDYDHLVEYYGHGTIRGLVERPDVFKPAIDAILNSISITIAEFENAETPEPELTDIPLMERLNPSQIVKGDWDELYPDVVLLTTEECAKHMGISQPTVLTRISENKLLGLTRSKRGYRIPADIFIDNKPVEGLKRLIESVSGISHNLVWSYLNSKIEYKDGLYLALDLLKEGNVYPVISGLRAFLEGYRP